MYAAPNQKPGEHRLVGIIALLIRLFFGMLGRTEVRAWDAATALPHDSAAPGRSCEKAAALHHFELEVVHTHGERDAKGSDDDHEQECHKVALER